MQPAEERQMLSLRILVYTNAELPEELDGAFVVNGRGS